LQEYITSPPSYIFLCTFLQVKSLCITQVLSGDKRKRREYAASIANIRRIRERERERERERGGKGRREENARGTVARKRPKRDRENRERRDAGQVDTEGGWEGEGKGGN